MFVYATFDSCLCLDFSNHSTTVDVLDVKLAIESRCGVPVKEQLVLIDGKVLSNEQCFDESTEVFCQVKLRGLLGGKGGFGSLLRGQKSTVRTTNFSACRDLNGRRLRHVEQDKALEEWNAKAAERELKAKLDKEKKREEARSSAPSYNDTTFASETKDLTDTVASAVAAAVQSKNEKKSASTSNANNDDVMKPKKRAKIWTDEDDEFGDLFSSEDESKTASTSTSTTKTTQPAQANEETRAESESVAATSGAGEGTTANATSDESGDDVAAVDLEQYASQDALCALGLDVLKAELQKRLMKSGGTLEERAARLWAVRGMHTIPSHLLAKSNKKRARV